MPQQFIVPQFIDVEDKIIGPITVRQFVIIIIAVVFAFVEFKIFRFIYFLPAGIFTIGIAAILAFARVNGRPIHYFLLNYIQTVKKPHLRVWNKEAYVKGVQEVKSEIKEKVASIQSKIPISGSRLQDISLLINTGGVYRSEDDILNDNIPQDSAKDKLGLKQ